MSSTIVTKAVRVNFRVDEFLMQLAAGLPSPPSLLAPVPHPRVSPLQSLHKWNATSAGNDLRGEFEMKGF